MRFKFNVFNMVIAITFLLAFVSVMFSYLTLFMFYPAIILFASAFIMLSISLIKNYIRDKNTSEASNDAIVLELSSEQEGEKYVMQNENLNKKQKMRQRFANFEKLLPAIISILISILFIYLLIKNIISGI